MSGIEPHLKDLDELRTFVQIVDSGSMTAAGRVLGLPTNVVSRRLAKLEERLGVPLAQRTTRRFRPTDEGSRLHQRAVRILEETTAAELELRGLTGELSGELRVSLPSLISELLRPALLGLLHAHPKVDLRLFVTDRPAASVLGDIAEFGLDAALLVGGLPRASILTRLLGRVRMVFAASPQYVERYGLPTLPTDLRDHECICYLGERLQTHWAVTDGQGNEQLVPVRGRFASSDSRALRQAMFDGLGIGVALAADLLDPQLVRVLPDYRAAPLDLRLGYAAARRGSTRINTLVEHLGPLVRDACEPQP